MYGVYVAGLKVFEPLQKISAAVPEATGWFAIIVGALIVGYGVWGLFQQFQGKGQGWVKPICALVFGMMLLAGGANALTGFSKFGEDVIKDITN